jgi:glycosyltransferase involved in cell wall biosynthesis
MPAISVVMSVFNGACYLREAIDSILLQTFLDFEFIIIDDGSTDDSLAIIKSYNDKRIIILEQENCGLSKSLNNGIAKAKASIIARMDADDISLPERLQIQYKFLQEHIDHVACGTWADVIDKKGNYVYTRKTIENSQDIKAFLKKCICHGLADTPFCHSSVMFRIETFKQTGGYSEYMFRAQDVVLFNRMSKIGKFHNIPVVLLKYRVIPEAISGIKMDQALLGELINKAINNEFVDERLINAVKKSVSKSNAVGRQYNYYLYLAKKYLWNNYSPFLARENLRNVMRIKPFNLFPLGLYLLSFFPPQLLFRIYRNNNSIGID